MLPDQTELDEYRKSIDNIDAAITFLLAERFRVTEKVGQYKAEHNLPAADPEREQRQLTRLKELSEASGLEAGFLEGFFTHITAEVKKRHNDIRHG